MPGPDVKIQGIRTPIPPGYVLGRTSTGTGDVELISIADLLRGSTTAAGSSGGGDSASARDAIVFDLGEGATMVAGTGLYHIRVPYRFQIVNVKAELEVPTTTGDVIVDINYGAASLLSTKLTIPAGGRTSMEVAVQPVWSPEIMGDDGILALDVDDDGDGTAVGLKVQIIGFFTAGALTATGRSVSLLSSVSQAAISLVVQVVGTIGSVLGQVTQEAAVNIPDVLAEIGSILGEVTQAAEADVTRVAGAHRYWGIEITAFVSSAGNGGFGEIEFFDAAGALLTYGLTAVSDNNSFTSGQGIIHANDSQVGSSAGNMVWTTANTTRKLWFDFGSAKAVARMRLVGVEEAFNSLMPKDFNVIYSDDALSWTTEVAVTAQTAWGQFEDRVWSTSNTPTYTGVPHASSTQWRYFVIDYYNPYFGMGMAEWELYATIGGARQVPTSAVAVSTNNGFVVTNLFDNNAATFWTNNTGGAITNQVALTYTYASAVTVAQLGQRARPDADANIGRQMPKRFILQWFDGTTWRFHSAWTDPAASFAAPGDLRKYASALAL